MKPRIVMSVFNNLRTDQRVEKICESLHADGYRVELIGNNWRGEPDMQRPYSWRRLKFRSKTLKFAYLEWQWKLYRHLMKTADADTILVANDLDCLWPNVRVARKKNIPLVYDSHEIFTEMPSVTGRPVQRLWRFLERSLMPKVEYMMTVNDSCAEWFSQVYKITRPTVVRNVPRRQEWKGFPGPNKKKTIIYQGAVNPSRGIDKAIRAMQFLPHARLLIAGEGPAEKEYRDLAIALNLNDRVEFLGNLAPEELRKVTERADAGLSIEEPDGLSYLYSLPNKVSDYIQARVPVVLAPLPELKRIAAEHKVGELLTSREPEKLAATIDKVLENGRAFYLPGLSAAAEKLNWEHEQPKLLDLYERVCRDRELR